MHVYQSYITKVDTLHLHLQCLMLQLLIYIKRKSDIPSVIWYHVAPAQPIIAIFIPQALKNAVGDRGFSMLRTLQTQGVDRASPNTNGQTGIRGEKEVKRGKPPQHLTTCPMPCALLCSALMLAYYTRWPKVMRGLWWDLCALT